MTTSPDFSAIKTKQQGAWSAGDYAVIGTTLQIVGETLCEALDMKPGSTVLDVCAGNGNVTLAAARRFTDVTSTDYVPSLLEASKRRATAEGLNVKYQEADVEKLPFGDNSFDYVVSTFGVMFTPDQDTAAKELARVTKSGGKIGLANWTPDGIIGKLFKLIGGYAPPPAGVKSPSLWGTRARIEELFAGSAAHVATASRNFNFRYKSPAHWIEVFRTYYGPIHKTFNALDADKQKSFEHDLTGLLESFNIAKDGSLNAPGEYLEVVITKK